MSSVLVQLNNFLTDIEPERKVGLMDDAQKMARRRSQALSSVADLRVAVDSSSPVMKTRQTGGGVVAYNSNAYFEGDGRINMRVLLGFKALTINGKKTFSAKTPEEAHQVLNLIEQAIKDGSLDDSLRALHEIPQATLRKMQDMRAINRLAKARVEGRALKAGDRTKLERLLRVPAYRETYNALTV